MVKPALVPGGAPGKVHQQKRGAEDHEQQANPSRQQQQSFFHDCQYTTGCPADRPSVPPTILETGASTKPERLREPVPSGTYLFSTDPRCARVTWFRNARADWSVHLKLSIEKWLLVIRPDQRLGWPDSATPTPGSPS